MRTEDKDPRIIVALDLPTADHAGALVARLDPALCRLKIGSELFVSAGPHFVEELTGGGYPVFLDLKFHDIPNTVAHACKAAARLGVWMINLHAGGGFAMMQAAREALEGFSPRPRLVAVTVLTSLSDADLARVGVPATAEQQVLNLARLADEAGLDGVVCSAREAAALRQTLSPEFLLVTPGIRPAGYAADDQRRIVTPAQAVASGADYLVVGRPVTRADDPFSALQRIHAEITPFLGEHL
jgi:orotidine-5'-phosphate decarboxylase